METYINGEEKMSDEFTPRDFLGREITVGDTVIYPVRRGSSMWLNKIIVTAIGDIQRPGGQYHSIDGVNDNGRGVTLTRLERCLVAASALCEYCGHNPRSSEG